MPELPETETIARGLEAELRGVRVVEVLVHRRDVLRECGAREFVRRVQGRALTRFWRRAKCVVAELDGGDRLVVTPRFTGALLVEAGAPRRGRGDYTAIELALGDGRTLRYRDVRRLGTVALMAPATFDRWTRRIGPEPLDERLSADEFSGILRGSSRAVKTILMDQRRIAGVGNIYANEALFRAGVRPARPGRRVRAGEAAAILTSLRAVLSESIARRGTTFRDYRDSTGAAGGFAAHLRVYGRGGQPCVSCGTALRVTRALEGRATYHCPKCQH